MPGSMICMEPPSAAQTRRSGAVLATNYYASTCRLDKENKDDSWLLKNFLRNAYMPYKKHRPAAAGGTKEKKVELKYKEQCTLVDRLYRGGWTPSHAVLHPFRGLHLKCATLPLALR